MSGMSECCGYRYFMVGAAHVHGLDYLLPILLPSRSCVNSAPAQGHMEKVAQVLILVQQLITTWHPIGYAQTTLDLRVRSLKGEYCHVP